MEIDQNPPPDADESQVPDADRIDDRADYPDPFFDDAADPMLERPVEGEDDGDEVELDDEPPELLEADENVDPEESDDFVAPPDG